MATDRPPDGSDGSERDDEPHAAYFEELNDGCGCAEIWEYLSERRRE